MSTNGNANNAGSSTDDSSQVRGVRYHEIEARKAYRLADAIYNNATEAELARFGNPEERCQLLGIFTYQLMEVANINRVHKGLVFRAAGFNKLGYGKPMKLSLAIARNEKARQLEEEKATQEGQSSNGASGPAENGNWNGIAAKETNKAVNGAKVAEEVEKKSSEAVNGDTGNDKATNGK